MTFHTIMSSARLNGPLYVARIPSLIPGSTSKSAKKWYAIASRGVMALMTLPKASGLVWICVPISRASEGGKLYFLM